VFIWGILALVTAVIELEDNPSNAGGSASAFESFINSSINSEEVAISDPNVGYQATNPISTVVSYGKTSAGYLTFMVKSAMLDSPIWEGWTQVIRFIIMGMSAPFIFYVTINIMGMLAGFIGGIFGRAFP